MSYDKKYRKRTIEYRQEGHTLTETSSVFKVSISMILDWRKLYEETGEYEKRPLNHSFKKIDPVKLESYIAAHPDAVNRYTVGLADGNTSGQGFKCITSPLQYDGTMDGALFEMWFEQLLLPALPQNTVIVMDNASFHRKKQAYCHCRKNGAYSAFSAAIFS